MHHASRRQFILAGSKAALAVPALSWVANAAAASRAHAAPPNRGNEPEVESAAVSPSEAPDRIPIVDTHQHLWDLEKLRLAWLTGAGPIHRSFVLKDYAEATRGLPVAKAVYMEVDVDPSQLDAEADYVLDICRRGDAPTCAAVIGGRPADPKFRRYITRFKGSPYIKGIRQILPGPREKGPFFLEKPFLDGIHLLGELRMSFDICTQPSSLPDAAKLVDRCPDTRFVLDHCGNADVKWIQAARKDKSGEAAGRLDQWRRGVAEMARRKSVVCKISGIIASVPKEGWGPDDLAPIIDHCLDSFGPDRVMFASDWPVCTLGAPLRVWVDTLRQIVRDRSLEDRRKLWGANAMAFYSLKK
jgi:L-fuconolactonase